MTELNKSGNTISSMFNDISQKYDFLNHFLSFGIDKLWRKKAKKIILSDNPLSILDVATGTADLAIEISKSTKAKITGVDFSEGMLEIGKVKVDKLHLSNQISLIHADALNLPFESECFDVISIAFGVRNFENLNKGLSELNRVLKKGGKLIILEFSTPPNKIIKALYYLYFRNILPFIGSFFSKNKIAYKYLFDSANAFPCGQKLCDIIKSNGFYEANQKILTFGVASIYCAKK